MNSAVEIQNLSDRCQALLTKAQVSPEEALQLFDALEPIDLEFMIGRWQGSEIQTSHPMNGWLEATNWYGKEFIDPETAHPLLFLDTQEEIIKVSPNVMAVNWALKLPILKSKALKPLFTLATTLRKTEKSQARLRMMDYRGKVSATMIYDYLPINDSFRKVNDNTVLGVMDFKALSEPFFFVLKRSAPE